MNLLLPSEHEKQILNQISEDATAYWKSQTLFTAVKLEIFNFISLGFNTIDLLSERLQIKPKLITILVKALISIQYLSLEENKICLTEKSKLLTHQEKSLIDIVKVWGSEHYNTWQLLDQALKNNQEQFSKLFELPFFDWINKNQVKKEEYYRAMHVYALKDYSTVVNYIKLSDHSVVVDLGGGLGTLSMLLSKKFPLCSFMVYDLPDTIQFSKLFIKNSFSNVSYQEGDFFRNHLPKADYYLLARVLHDWNDSQALEILKNIVASLKSSSEIIIIEHPISKDMNDNWGALLDLNMKVITGGSEITLTEYTNIILEAGLSVSNVIIDPVTGINLINCKKP